jgi:hypothetical protein
MIWDSCFKVKMKNLEWDECLCECYILKVNLKNIEWGQCFYVNVTYDCCRSQSNMRNIEWLFQSKYEKYRVRSMFMWMLHVNSCFKVNMRNIEWGQCLCKCYILTVVGLKVIWEISSEVNVYVNVTYDCCSQSKNEKPWVRWMFMRMLHSQSDMRNI